MITDYRILTIYYGIYCPLLSPIPLPLGRKIVFIFQNYKKISTKEIQTIVNKNTEVNAPIPTQIYSQKVRLNSLPFISAWTIPPNT